MPRTNLPLREADIVTWTGEFLNNLQVEPGDYGVDATQVSNYAVTRNRFVTAYGLVQNR